MEAIFMQRTPRRWISRVRVNDLQGASGNPVAVANRPPGRSFPRSLAPAGGLAGADDRSPLAAAPRGEKTRVPEALFKVFDLHAFPRLLLRGQASVEPLNRWTVNPIHTRPLA